MNGESNDQKAFIIEGAFRVFDENGIAGVTLKRVARQCGLSTADVAQHFSDDTRLITAMVAFRDDRIATRLRQYGVEHGYRAILGDVVQAITADPVGTRLFVVTQHAALDPAHPMHDYLHMRSVHAVDSMRQLFEPHFADPDSLSLEVIAILEGLQIKYAREPEAFDVARHWASIADALFAGAEPAAADYEAQRLPGRSSASR